jgi:cephalosporin hydroxylase
MKYLEDNLDMPIKDLLNIMQNRCVYNTKYFGIPTIKSPIDFWLYQEIIFQTKPDIIVEIGTYYGGSTLGLAHIFDNMNQGCVIGIDIDHRKVALEVKEHPRIELITADACEAFNEIKQRISDHEKVLIIEDSSHEFENTLNILRTYSPLISPGGYFIVEDSICHHGLAVGPKPGPYEAIEQFVSEKNNFIIDRSREDFLITWNPKGFLKHI